MALDDADEETGCVEYAIRSHKWRPILHQENTNSSTELELNRSAEATSSFHSSDETSYRDSLTKAAKSFGVTDHTINSVPTKEGHTILHHQEIWHGSGRNVSTTRHRHALVAHYIHGDVTFQSSETRCNGPFGTVSYIYGRYKRYNRIYLNESFFPIIYGPTRTEWIDDFFLKV
jgi:ectoine hydroxylase-related dioxygenase (phytanoyl-CoA dioxygenase family)